MFRFRLFIRCLYRSIVWVGQGRLAKCVAGFSLLAIALLASVSDSAAADPQPWGTQLPPAANVFAESLLTLYNDWLVPLTIVITLFVMVLIGYVCIRFRESANPVPSKRIHFPALEVIWTVIPAIIVVIIMVPSIRTIRASADLSNTELTVKAIGNQWFWSYQYPDHGNFVFDSYPINESDPNKPEGYRRLMSVDNPLVIPADTKIKIQITSNDVLHNWSVSEFGVRMDATPGYLREVPIYPIAKVGTYYGFCSELCGNGHSFMPIEVRVVSKADFAQWVKGASDLYAQLDVPQLNTPELGVLVKADDGLIDGSVDTTPINTKVTNTRVTNVKRANGSLVQGSSQISTVAEPEGLVSLAIRLAINEFVPDVSDNVTDTLALASPLVVSEEINASEEINPNDGVDINVASTSTGS